jgi:putative nucleotidyltransferase with HDIG domain
VLHLVKRFFGSLAKREISADDQEWVVSNLSIKELKLWSGQMLVDQAHSLQIARRFVVLLPNANREEIAAALLHDVGKSIARIGVIARVMATILPDRVVRKNHRFAAYRGHEKIGAEMLRAVGSSEVTVALVEGTASTKAANALLLADRV